MTNNRFDNTSYIDPHVRSWADQVQAAYEADLFHFDRSDLMPPAVGTVTFLGGIVELVAGTKTIPEILDDIDASWPV